MRVRQIGSMLLMVVSFVASDARAQIWGPPPPAPPPRPYSADTPARELGVNLALWGIEQTGGGGRFTRNVTEWFAFETSLDGHGTGHVEPAYLIAVANARLLFRFPDTHAIFVTAGAGGGFGLSYAVSPMIGGGLQAGWRGPVTFRGELQYFTRGRPSRDKGRLLLGLVVALPE